MADFSRVLAGPYATMMLADLGADVIKVERPPHGDDTRAWGPPYAADGTATYFQSVNRNKRSVVAGPVTTRPTAERADELARSADVVVENFAPGTMARFGLGYAERARRSTPGSSTPRSRASAPAPARTCPATTSSSRPWAA